MGEPEGGELGGKVALITGTSRGIGRAIAERFAAEGAAVVAVASRLGTHGDLPGTLEQTVADLQARGARAAAEVCDLSDGDARQDLVERAAAHFGPVDVLVNNAARGDMMPPSRSTREQRDGLHDLNLNVPVELIQQALPAMRERGGGWILNISTRSAVQEPPPYPDRKDMNWMIGAYGASKAALNRYTEALAHELAGHGIFVNAMAPTSIVMTPGAEFIRDIAQRRPDMVEPVEMMAEAALELCTGRHVGLVTYSRDILLATARPLKGLDGQSIIGDAFTLVEL